MPDLDFRVASVAVSDGSMTPQLDFALHVAELDGRDIDTVVLSCQIMIEAVQRAYDPSEREALLDLFGTPERWGTTLKTMLWTHTATVVPRFSGETEVTLSVPSTFDLSIASTKYFFALQDGEVPLNFQFSGTVFYRDRDGALMTQRISWTKEARFRLPVRVWRELMQRHHPEGAWICVPREVFERLDRFRSHRGLVSWGRVVDELLEDAGVQALP